ncbi:MAG: calcium/sodium antiporter [Victivallaceae bacterium]|nr:calcium/sodium antiporter [Victivallaceae bacterium]
MELISFSTDMMTINILLFIVGLVILIKGSDWFVEAAAQIARSYNIPEIIIGLTLVSIGTSMPELATDIYASLNSEGDIVIGVVVGSNITNITLVLGAGIIMMKQISTPKNLVKRDIFFMLGIFILLLLCGHVNLDGYNGISRIEGGIMLGLLIAYFVYLFKNREVLKDELPSEEHCENKFNSSLQAWIFMAVGTILIVAGAKTMVDNAIWTAEKLSMSKALIAATVVAFGTSVPELAVTITSVIKKRHDMALGNIIGSSIFNIILIIGICATISPITIGVEMNNVIMPIMVACGLMLAVFMRTGWKLVRWEGAILLATYIAFITYNIVKIS